MVKLFQNFEYSEFPVAHETRINVNNKYRKYLMIS